MGFLLRSSRFAILAESCLFPAGCTVTGSRGASCATFHDAACSDSSSIGNIGSVACTGSRCYSTSERLLPDSLLSLPGLPLVDAHCSTLNSRAATYAFHRSSLYRSISTTACSCGPPVYIKGGGALGGLSSGNTPAYTNIRSSKEAEGIKSAAHAAWAHRRLETEKRLRLYIAAHHRGDYKGKMPSAFEERYLPQGSMDQMDHSLFGMLRSYIRAKRKQSFFGSLQVYGSFALVLALLFLVVDHCLWFINKWF